MDTSESSRRYARIDLEARVQVSSIDPERDPNTGTLCYRESDELCGNLSVGGAFFRTLDPPAPGRRLLLQIHLPGGESVEAVGRVAWTRLMLVRSGEPPACGVGVEFVEASGETQSVLERYLASTPKREPNDS